MKTVYTIDEYDFVELDYNKHPKNTREIHFLYYDEEGGIVKNRIPGKINLIDSEIKKFKKHIKGKSFFWHCNHSDPFVGTKDYHITWPDFDYYHAYSENKIIKKDIQKLYACQMYSLGYHRDLLCEKLYDYKQISQGFVSYKENALGVDPLYDKYVNDTKNKNFKKQWRSEISKYFDDPLDIWSKSCFNIVTESWFDVQATNNDMLTEKTYCCILQKQPFVIVGYKNANSLLKQDGYKLYDNVFDYSFDALDTIEERIEHLVSQLTKLNIEDFDNTVDEIANHNYNVYLDKLKSIKLPEIFYDSDTYWYPAAKREKDKLLKLKSHIDTL